MEKTVNRPAGGDRDRDAAAPIAFVALQDFDDPCAWEMASHPWEILGTRVETPFRHQKRILVTPNWLAYCESFQGALRIQGLTPAGMFGYSVPLRTGGSSSFWGGSLHERGLPASLPGALDARVDAGQSQLILLVRLDWLRAQVDTAIFDDLEQAALRRLLPAAVRERQALGIWLLSLLARFHYAPWLLTEPAVVNSIEHDLLRWLLSTVRLPDQPASRPTPNRRRRGFDRAIEWLREADLSTLDCAGLTALAGVSRRTLDYAFHAELGLSPWEFVHKLRLHGVRRALHVAESGTSTVADVAAAHGFYQFGRFAGDYRRAFGELPSATLRRPCPERIGGLLEPA